MLQDYKFWLSAIAIFLTFYAYIAYYKGIFQGKTKPHLFTWIVWSIITLIAAIIQMFEKGGMGAWPTLAAALVCFGVTLLAVKYGSKDVKPVDYFFLCASLSAIPLWVATNNPAYSAILVTAIEIIAAFPTVRKSWHNPEHEVMSTYGINSFRFALSIAALGSISISTITYPLGMILMNGGIFFVLFLRQRQRGRIIPD